MPGLLAQHVGSAGLVILFEIGDDEVVVGAVRHQRQEDYHR
jgi:plasmid stabilization system protein ParE